ncbi:MAG: hypothetical protein HYY13_03145 [Nitrospirae bacterium]|nr:hypothetical protein [Nitrospirota bacterium]
MVRRVLFLSSVGLIAGLLTVEFGLRLFAPQPLYSFEKGLFQPFEPTGYRLTPGFVGRHSQPEYSYAIHANSYGFRGEEPNPDAGFRVLVLGDSYGMGQGVEEGEGLVERAEGALRDRYLDVDLFNTSVSGYATVNQLGVLSHLAPLYRPHLALVLLAWNDVGVETSLQVQDGFLVLATDRQSRLREWLNTHSHVYCAVKRAWYTYLGHVEGREGLRAGISEKALDVTVDLFRRMQDVARREDFSLVVLYMPTSPLEERSEAFVRGKRVLAQRLEGLGIAVQDWWGILPPDERWRSMIFPVDGHWKSEGHAHFGRALEAFLLDYASEHGLGLPAAAH